MDDIAQRPQQTLSQERWERMLHSVDAAPWDWDLSTREVYLSP